MRARVIPNRDFNLAWLIKGQFLSGVGKINGAQPEGGLTCARRSPPARIMPSAVPVAPSSMLADVDTTRLQKKVVFQTAIHSKCFARNLEEGARGRSLEDVSAGPFPLSTHFGL